MFSPGESKRDLQRTLEHFGVNRTFTMTVSEFVSRYEEGSIDGRLCNLRSFIPGDSFRCYSSNQNLYQNIKTIRANDQTHYVCENLMVADHDHLICNGEALLYTDEFRVWAWAGFVNKTKGLSLRAASLHPAAIYIKNRHQVPKPVFNLIWEKGLIGFVVEFSIYTVPVGILHKPLLIWEIRKY